MKIDVFVCTNEVNYTVAVSGELSMRPRPALVLYDPVRSDRRRVRGAWQRPFRPRLYRVVRLLAWLRLLGTAYIPHHRFEPRLLRELRQAPRIAYLDDGLDTLRRVPNNFDADVLGRADPAPHGREPYLTFREHQALPQWLEPFDVQPVCSIRELAHTGHKPIIDLAGIDHVFVESPGLDPEGLMGALGIDPRRALCVRHPVPHKRGPLPAQCRSVDGRGHDLEATMLAARSLNFYFGSTMTLVFALLTGGAQRNRIFVQLDDAQRDNLLLPGRFDVVSGAVLRHPLMEVRADTMAADPSVLAA